MDELTSVILRAPSPIDDAKVCAAAARYGVALEAVSNDGETATFALPEGEITLARMDGPHPALASMVSGPLAIEPEKIEGASAHLLVVGSDLPGDQRARELILTLVTVATLDAMGGLAAMLVPGVIFHRPELVHDLVELARGDAALPLELAVDVTIAPEEEDDRMSFLTHGLARAGSEELYVTCSVRGRGALDFVLGVARWFYSEPTMRLPTGDTLGRSETERVLIQRVPSPIDPAQVVVRLDLDL